MVLPTPFYVLLFSASAVITVSDFYAPEVRFSCVLTNISGHPLLPLLPLLLYSLHRCLLRSQGVPGTNTKDAVVSKKDISHPNGTDIPAEWANHRQLNLFKSCSETLEAFYSDLLFETTLQERVQAFLGPFFQLSLVRLYMCCQSLRCHGLSVTQAPDIPAKSPAAPQIHSWKRGQRSRGGVSSFFTIRGKHITSCV